MGGFINVTGVLGATGPGVEAALAACAAEAGGKFKPTAPDRGDATLFYVRAKNVTLLHQDAFFLMHGAQLAVRLSEALGKAVFALHIHDGDLWSYELYERGELVDQFSTSPDYFQKLSVKERKKWAGNAEVVAKACGRPAEKFSRFLRQKKQSAWEMVDFMTAVGLTYPIGKNGLLPGTKAFLLRLGPKLF